MGSIGRNRQHKQGLRVGILVIAIIACAWLFPAGSGMAASSSSDFTVTVTVMDANTVDVGDQVFNMVDDEDVEVTFVSRVGSDLGEDGESYSEMKVTVSRL